VVGSRPLDRTSVGEAVEEAGYHLQ
jgi:hypothetical protein